MASANINRSYSSHRKRKPRRHITTTIFALALALTSLLSGDLTRAQDFPDVNLGVPSATGPFTFMPSVIVASTNQTSNSTNAVIVEEFVGEKNCTVPAIYQFPSDLFTQTQRRHGAVIIHFVVSVYIFYAIALICDDYFVPAIETICEFMHLPSDVAGATFMAIATSAPELFTNIIGTFITEGDLGVGTIVGSAVFNILAICACCGLAAKETLRLDWWSLTRDCFFYSLSVILLLVVLTNRKVFWYEALLLVMLYLVYIIVMYFNTNCKRQAEKFLYGFTGKFRKRTSFANNRFDKKVATGADEKTPLLNEAKITTYDLEGAERSLLSPTPSNSSSDALADDYECRDEELIAKALRQTEENAADEEEAWGLLSLPYGQGLLKWTEWILGWPARFCFVVTIPDCRNHRFRQWYPLTFLMSIVWIALLTYIMSWMMTIIGHTLSLPDSVMGLTLIAAGTSVPEAVSSIIVTRQGLGSMGISNSIGSNTFDILICLGVPWLIKSSLDMYNPSGTPYVAIISGGLEYSTMLLIGSVLLLYLLLACNGFVLNRQIGFLALGMYGVFLVVSSLFELNVFFPVNPPTCID